MSEARPSGWCGRFSGTVGTGTSTSLGIPSAPALLAWRTAVLERGQVAFLWDEKTETAGDDGKALFPYPASSVPTQLLGEGPPHYLDWLRCSVATLERCGLVRRMRGAEAELIAKPWMSVRFIGAATEGKGRLVYKWPGALPLLWDRQLREPELMYKGRLLAGLSRREARQGKAARRLAGPGAFRDAQGSWSLLESTPAHKPRREVRNQATQLRLPSAPCQQLCLLHASTTGRLSVPVRQDSPPWTQRNHKFSWHP